MPSPVNDNSSLNKLNRRTFLQTALGAGAISLLAPRSLLSTASGAPAVVRTGQGQKVRLAAIGIGNRGRDVLKALADTGLAEIVALCDTDLGSPAAQPMLKQFPKVPRYQDFRQMFDRMAGSIDAVCICTPDFSHFPATMLAMSAASAGMA